MAGKSSLPGDRKPAPISKDAMPGITLGAFEKEMKYTDTQPASVYIV